MIGYAEGDVSIPKQTRTMCVITSIIDIMNMNDRNVSTGQHTDFIIEQKDSLRGSVSDELLKKNKLGFRWAIVRLNMINEFVNKIN